MSSTREGKKGFRARAKATLKGLTIDTSLAQTNNSENVDISVGGSKNGGLSMLSRHKNKEFQEKPKWNGLTIDTKLTQDAYEVGNTSAAVDAKLAQKASITNTPRLSEAMMNTDWRNHRRAPEKQRPSIIEPLWTAPPEQSKFPDHVKDKPQRNDEDEVFDYDRGLERVAYRSRRPDEVRPELIPFTTAGSVNAELCLSAPATKLEFSEAEIGGDERSKKYDPSVFQPAVKSIVRLDKMAPTKRAGYEKIISWDEQRIGSEKSNRTRLRESSSITTVTPIDSSSSWESVEFPYAEIRPVKGNKKFETGLSSVEETVRMQLSALVEPQTAGLPPEYLRKEYEELREERRKAMSFVNSTVEASVCQDDTESISEAPDTSGTKDVEFNVLLGRLNKLCAPRLRAYTTNDKDDSHRPALTTVAENTTNGSSERSLSRDSAISGLSSRGRTRSSTLNPEAMEFRATEQKKSPVANDYRRVVSSPNASANAGPASSQTADPIQRLETRVAELEAQLAKQHSKKAQPTRQRSAFGGRKKSPPGVAEYGFAGPQGVYNLAANIMQGSAGYQALQSVSPYQAQPGLAMGAGEMNVNPMPATAHYQLAGNNAGFPSNGMPMGFNNPYNAAQPSVPFQGNGGPAGVGPSTGTPLWVKNVFGPKPVSKPNRPFQPGDGGQAVRQQQYEEYLEHLRATDPSYAIKCKQRQARRADRQRFDPGGGMGPQKLLY
ncbi:hypothetical protein F4861DRAFT_421982 [Xylaria intraflava]|nr:hypothetical protein F4861DRAFT_421982 [Xylaria intraflava]